MPPLDHVVAAARRGEAWAWSDLFVRYNRLVVSSARRYGLSREHSDDVAQTTWLRLVERIGDLRDLDAVAGWLVTTSSREACVVLRRSRREVLCDEAERMGVPSASDDVDEAVDAERLARRLRVAITALPPRERRLVRALLDPAGRLSYREIGARLSMPVGSIGPIRQRALRRLRDALRERPSASPRPVVPETGARHGLSRRPGGYPRVAADP